MSCPHTNIAFRASVDLPDEEHGHSARISARCKDCGAKMEWVGASQEPSETRPYVDSTGTELRAPLREAGTGAKGRVQ